MGNSCLHPQQQQVYLQQPSLQPVAPIGNSVVYQNQTPNVLPVEYTLNPYQSVLQRAQPIQTFINQQNPQNVLVNNQPLMRSRLNSNASVVTQGAKNVQLRIQ